MATNLAIDDSLIESVVTQALQEYIQKRQQLKLTELFGQIDYAPDYDYKAQRNRGVLSPDAKG